MNAGVRAASAAWLLLAVTAVAEPPAGIAVDGVVDKPFRLTLDELKEMPRQTVRAKDRDGKPAVYEGVWLRDVLRRGGVPLGGQQLHGEALGLSVIVRSADGYRVAFGLAEFDDDFAERQILLADTRDGKPLGGKEGALRVVVPQEAKQGRWARQVIGLTVVAPPKP